MADINRILCYWLLKLAAVTIFTLSSKAYEDTTVKASVPVNPVESGGILSLSCKVSNLDKAIHTVQIFRRIADTGRSEQLSVDDGVLQNVDDRVFLAFRQLEGTSAIYFLSVMEVTQADQGVYSCKIITKDGTIREVASDAENISVMYFPSDPDPVCGHLEHLTVNEGDLLVFNCSSELANPPVSITWRRTQSSEPLKGAETSIKNQRLYSVLQIKASRKQHHGVVFLCEISSAAFPNTVRNCHIGPLSIIYDGTQHDTDFPIDVKPTASFPVSTAPDLVKGITSDDKDTAVTTLTAQNCRRVCSYTASSSALLYWVIATVLAVFLCLLFLMAVIFICARYRNIDEELNDSFCAPRVPTTARLPDGIYSELECKQVEESKMYMSLGNSTAETVGSTGVGPVMRPQHHHQHFSKTGGHYGALPCSSPYSRAEDN